MVDHPKIQQGDDGTLLLNFGAYGEEVEVAAISGDGRRILTVREVGTAQVWDVASGDQVGEIRPDSPLAATRGTAPVGGAFEVFIESAALDADGSTALLGLNDGTAGTFRVADGVRLAVLHPPGEEPAREWGVIRTVAYHGEHALVGFPRRAVGVWSRHGDRAVAFLRAPVSRLVGRPFVRDTLTSSVGMSADGRFVFGGAVDLTATIWDLRTGEAVFEALEHAEQLVTVFDTEHGVGWATTGGAVWLWGRKVIASGEHWDEVCVHGGRFLTRGFRDEVKRWSLAGDCEVLAEARDASGVGWASSAITLASAWRGDLRTPGGSTQVIAHADGKRRVVVRRTDGEPSVIDRDAVLVTLLFTPRGDALVTEGWKDEAELWSLAGERLHTFAAPGGVGDVAVSPDGSRIAIGTIGNGGGRYTRHVIVYDTASGAEIQRHGEHDWQVAHVAFSPDGNTLASVGDEIVLWGLADRRVVARIDTRRSTTSLAYLADGRLLILDEGRARIVRDATVVRDWRVPIGYDTRWCISADGRRLVIALRQAVVRFDLETGAQLDVIAADMPRPEHIPGAACWRTAYGMYLHQSDGPRGWVQPQVLSADGLVAAPDRDRAVILRVTADAVAEVTSVPFTGRLRASRFVDGEVLLVNHQGRLFRSQACG